MKENSTSSSGKEVERLKSYLSESGQQILSSARASPEESRERKLLEQLSSLVAESLINLNQGRAAVQTREIDHVIATLLERKQKEDPGNTGGFEQSIYPVLILSGLFFMVALAIVALGREEDLQRARDTADFPEELRLPPHSDGEGAARELKSVKDRIREIVDNSIDVICFLDENGRINSVSRSCRRLFELEPGELSGRPLVDLIKADLKAALEEKLAACRISDTPLDFETAIVAPSGNARDVYMSIKWSANYNLTLCLIHDVTELKRLENMRKEIILMVSHDIRSPLMNIQMCLDYIQDPRLAGNEKKMLEMAGRAAVSSQAVLSLVNDFLMTEKIDSGTISLEPADFDLHDLVEECADTVQGLMETWGVTFDYPREELFMEGDRQKLGQVIINLISNAAKYSPRGSRIKLGYRIDAGGIASNGDMVKITISDQGCGIEAERLESIFKQFEQGENGKVQGYGFGLAICKRLVGMHHGEIRAESEVGNGSTFIVDIPRRYRN